MNAPADQRPIAARNTRLAIAVTAFLVRRGASANGISVAGLVAGTLAGVALALTSEFEGWPRRVCWLAGALLILIRLLANMFDGMVATASGRSSRVGELFNELPDRVSDAAALIGLGYAAGGRPELGYLAALAAVLVAYVRALGRTAGAPNIFVGPMAKQQRMAVVILTALLCAALPDDWMDTARLATWALVLCLAGSIFTIVYRLVLIVGHLKGPSS